MSLSLLLQQCSAYLSWIHWWDGGKRPYSCFFMEYSFQDLFKKVCSILVKFPSSFFCRLSLESKWCNHTVVLIRQLGRIWDLRHDVGVNYNMYLYIEYCVTRFVCLSLNMYMCVCVCMFCDYLSIYLSIYLVMCVCVRVYVLTFNIYVHKERERKRGREREREWLTKR